MLYSAHTLQHILYEFPYLPYLVLRTDNILYLETMQKPTKQCRAVPVLTEQCKLQFTQEEARVAFSDRGYAVQYGDRC